MWIVVVVMFSLTKGDPRQVISCLCLSHYNFISKCHLSANQLIRHGTLNHQFARYVFGFREDGSEGICCPTRPTDNIIQPPPIIPTISEDPPSTNNVQETKT